MKRDFQPGVFPSRSELMDRTKSLIDPDKYIHTDIRYFDYLGDHNRKTRPHLKPAEARELIKIAVESVLKDYKLSGPVGTRLGEQEPLYDLRDLITYDLSPSDKLSERGSKTAWGLFRPYGSDSPSIGAFTWDKRLDYVRREINSIAKSKGIKFNKKFELIEEKYDEQCSYDIGLDAPGIIINGNDLKALNIVLEHINKKPIMLRRLETFYIEIQKDKHKKLKDLGGVDIEFDTLPPIIPEFPMFIKSF